MAKLQRKILLVDDAPEDRAIIKHYLLQDPAYDYLIWEEESVENALATYRTVQPDCLLLDYTLPDCDGLQFLTHLSEHMREQAPAVVMLTGTGNEVVAVEAMKRGVQDYLHKDALSRERLWHAVANAVEKAALRQALEAQRQQTSANEARLRLAFAAAHMGTWVWNPATGEIHFSPETEALWGLAPGTFAGTFDAFLAALHPDDRTIFHSPWKTREDGVTHDLEYRIVLPDGTVRWVAVRGQILADFEGKGRWAHGVMMDITARKQAEEALARESRERRRVEEQYRLVTTAANDAVYQVDPAGCVAFATPALARLTGYTMKELLGRPSTDLYTPETAPTFLERRRHALNGQAVSPYLEANMLRKDGARVPVELAVTNFIEDGRIAGRVAVARDITARKQAEEELGRLHNELERLVEERTAELAHTVAALRAEVKERKQAEVALQASDLRYRSLFENAAEGIFLSTPEGRFLEVNPALVRMLGYDSADEMLALHLPEDLYVNSTDRGRLLAQFESQGTIDGVELPWKKKNGVPMVVSLHARTVLDAQGTVVSYEGMVLDVTERKQAEQALEALSRRVLEVQETERRALARELHDEMGQALMALRLNLRAAQRMPHLQSARLEDSLSIVDTLVQQVRQLSLDLRPSLLDDVGLVAALRWYVDRLAQRAGLVIHFSAEGLESRHSPMLETTCFRLIQEALTNVLRHARAHHVWIEVRQHNQELHLRIRDDGIGFDVRAVRERTSQGESLGILGMEERVRLVEGQFSLTSVLSHGTEMYARFPLVPSAGATVGLASLDRIRPSNTDDKKST